MAPELAILAVIFPVTVIGLGWPLASRLALDPLEKILASVVVSLLVLYAGAFLGYLCGASPATGWIFPAAGVLALGLGRGRNLARHPEVRAWLFGQLLIAAWCVGWLALVPSYSGGGWTGDWYEHWQRAEFFLQHWPLDAKFLGVSLLPARPPLANLVTALFLGLSGNTFPAYQFVTTLFSALVFLPAALLARRFTSDRSKAMAVLAALVMASPLFVQNATFAWTKLPTAFFILSGLYFFLRTRESAAPTCVGVLCALSLAGGLLSHYSAGPYVVLLAIAWVASGARWRESGYRRQTAWAVLAGAAVLATWFGWALAHYGWRTTVTSNTSVTTLHPAEAGGFMTAVLNIADTLVPHFLRPISSGLIQQSSSLGATRDALFQAYQLNLFFAFGSIGWLVIAQQLWRDRKTAAPSTRRFWTWFLPSVFVLGVAVHGDRDHWGLMHICLQALVVLGLAYLAASWSRLGRGWRVALVIGGAIDLIGGIVLHFAVQHDLRDVRLFNANALMNFAAKQVNRLDFVADIIPWPASVIIGGLALLLVAAIVRVRTAPAGNGNDLSREG